MILSNAPYLPTENEKPSIWIDYAWFGGKNSRELIDRFIAHVSEYLQPEGHILLVQSTLSNVKETQNRSIDITHGRYGETLVLNKTGLQRVDRSPPVMGPDRLLCEQVRSRKSP